jgi:methionyl-tRNA formyltransferase
LKAANVKLIVMGTGPFAVPMFQALLESPHAVLGLVTRPISDGGRRKDSANPMRDVALAANVPVLSPRDVNDPQFVAWLLEQRADLFAVCDFGQILSRDCLAAARLGGINLHGSLLPKYRGAAPVQWAVYQGEPTTGVSVIHMTPKLDAGPILAQAETAIGADETSQSLEPRLAELGAAAVMQALAMLTAWNGAEPLGRSQDPSQASRAPRLRKDQGRINWSEPARQIRNQIRAFAPWPGSYTLVPRDASESLRLIVHQAREADSPGPFPAGTVIRGGPGALVVACGQGALALSHVQPAGKRSMSIEEFLRGHPIPQGIRLG